MHSCVLSILIVVMVIREGHSKRHNFKFDLRNCQNKLIGESSKKYPGYRSSTLI